MTSGVWRKATSIGSQAVFGIGTMILTGMAYMWRDWRQLQFVQSIASVAFVVIFIFLPESPRYSITIVLRLIFVRVKFSYVCVFYNGKMAFCERKGEGRESYHSKDRSTEWCNST